MVENCMRMYFKEIFWGKYLWMNNLVIYRLKLCYMKFIVDIVVFR